MGDILRHPVHPRRCRTLTGDGTWSECWIHS